MWFIILICFIHFFSLFIYVLTIDSVGVAGALGHEGSPVLLLLSHFFEVKEYFYYGLTEYKSKGIYISLNYSFR